MVALAHRTRCVEGRLAYDMSPRSKRCAYRALALSLLYVQSAIERELVLPGDELEVTIRIMQPGAWMYMCMFPYDMQFGMMGVMATEGMAMDMGGMSM